MRRLLGVRRDRGDRYLFLMTVSFAVTVLAVRVYLDAAGYPKVGGGGLHVAHMLWGGLLLVVSIVILLLFVGRRALAASAIAAGVGVGLFIDEVGKFVTESNDYFFAPAAPIIYGAVLFLVLIWLVARRHRRPSPDEAIQAGIDAVRDLADGRLSRLQRDRAVDDLRAASVDDGDSPLAQELVRVLSTTQTETGLANPGWMERGDPGRLFHRFMPVRLEKFLIRVGLFLTLPSVLLGVFLAALYLAGDLPSTLPVPEGPIEFPRETVWIIALMAVWIVVGTVNGLALILSLVGRHERAMAIAEYGVLAGLVAGGLLNTYVSQLGALSGVILQLLLLGLIIDQRGRIAVDLDGPRPAGTHTVPVVSE